MSVYYIESGDEEYFIHQIKGMPSYDQVIEVRSIDIKMKKKYSLTPLVIEGLQDRPLSSGLIRASVMGGNEYYKFRVGKEIYLELDDLSK